MRTHPPPPLTRSPAELEGLPRVRVPERVPRLWCPAAMRACRFPVPADRAATLRGPSGPDTDAAFVAAAPPGTGAPSWRCINIQTDPRSCGGCPGAGGIDCTEVPGQAGVTCSGGACVVVACMPGMRLLAGRCYDV